MTLTALYNKDQLIMDPIIEGHNPAACGVVRPSRATTSKDARNFVRRDLIEHLHRESQAILLNAALTCDINVSTSSSRSENLIGTSSKLNLMI